MRDVHLINPFENAFGGSERRTLSLAGLLQGKCNLKVWSLQKPDFRLKTDASITPVDVSKLRFPKGGTLVFVGSYFEVPTWVSVARPERVILVYNIPYPPHVQGNLYVLRAYGIPRIDVVVAGQSLAEHVRPLGCEPNFEPSWIDIRRFSPSKARPDRPFTVGRLSRDVVDKFHHEDPKLFRELAEAGVKVRLMGATCIANPIGPHPNLEVLPAGAMPAEKFLSTIDALVYRTSTQWTEAWGRVVGEAMAMGMPVILEDRIGFCEVLTHDKDALIFRSTSESMEHVLALRADPARAEALGEAARQTVLRLYGPEAQRRIVEFYTA